MPRLLALLPLLLLAGCSKNDTPKPAPQNIVIDQPKGTPQGNPAVPGALPPDLAILPVAGDDRQEKYQAALVEALTLSADHKWAASLTALETARSFQETEFIKSEIEKVKARLDQEASAQKTVTNIQTILEEGKVEEANKLAQLAMKEFGEAAPPAAANQLQKLRLQAEALYSTQVKEDPQARYQRFRIEGEQALQEKNLRAAALAYEQALQQKEDAVLKNQLDDLRDKLNRYDALRQQAAPARRDPARFEEALALLEQAGQSWDNLQIRQEIDEVRLALQNRREKVSVADFEVHGEIGIPDAGDVVAEELLPFLKPRFDLVERGQFNKVLEELKLENDLNFNPASQREVGKLAKVRYLVLGSVRRQGGVVATARLVDVQSGLILQTAKLTAPTPQELLANIGELGKQLLMNDAEKQAYDLQQAQQAQRPAPVDVAQPLPPPPQPIVQQQVVQSAPQVIPYTAAPPDYSGVTQQQFQSFPAAPLPGQPIPVLPYNPIEEQYKTKLMYTAVQVGDDAYLHNRQAEAQRHFSFALSLAPGKVGLQLRLDNCAPPPPPVRQVVVVQQPVIIARPRVAVLPFPTYGPPSIVPPHLVHWTPQQLQPYLLTRYDIADPGEVFWYMGKLNMSLRDLMQDPYARRWLGRALNIRYFLIGTQVATASFDVNTYLIDAEHGYLQGSGRIHVRNPRELKLRLSELAQVTMMDPAARAAYVAEQQRFEVLFQEGQRRMEQRQFALAMTSFETALKIRVGNTQVQVYLNQARGLQDRYALEEARRQEFERQQAFAAAQQRRQWELAQAAEAARIRAAQDAALRADLDRKLFEDRRNQAQFTLVIAARNAFKSNDFALSIRNFESALQMAPNDVYARELAQAKAEQARSAQLIAQQQEQLRQQQAQAKRDQELALAKQQLEQERQRAEAAALAAQKAQQERDQLAYQTAYDEGERYLAGKNYDAALSAFQGARRVKKTEVVELMIQRTIQAKAEAGAKDEAERTALEQKLAFERKKRLAAEAEAKEKQNQYQVALAEAQKALAEKNLELAEAKFQTAGQLFKTDAVLSGLQKTQTTRTQIAQEAETVKKRKLDEAQKAERLQGFLDAGNQALQGQQYDVAVKTFQNAKKFYPDNIDILTGLVKAETARDKQLADIRRKVEESDRLANFQRFLKSGQDNLANKQFDAAVIALSEAVKLNPEDAGAKAALQAAQKAAATSAANTQAAEASKKKAAVYAKHLEDGKIAMASKRYGDAIQAFNAAQKVMPGDKTSADFLEDVRKRQEADNEAVAQVAKKKAFEAKRLIDVQNALTAGRQAMFKKDFAAAQKSFQAAAELVPQDPQVSKAMQDLSAMQKLADAEAQAQKARGEAIDKAISDARAALATKNPAAADKAIGFLRSLEPTNPNLAQFQTELSVLQKSALESEIQAKTQAAYQQAVKNGQDLVAAKKYDEAVQAFQQAAKLNPGDAKLPLMIQQAQKAAADVQAESANALKTQQAYQQALSAGQNLMAAKKYDEAAQAFQQAAKLNPGDAKLPLMIQQAQKAAADAQAESANALKTQQAYQQALTAGQNLMAAKKYDEAAQAFQQAAKLNPGDAKLPLMIQQAQKAAADAQAESANAAKTQQAYQQALTAGQNALAAKKYDEAIAAFQSAAKLNPGDAKLPAMIQQAQQAKIAAGAEAAAEGKKQAAFLDLLKAGQIHMNQKQYPAAIKSFSDALQMYPTNPQAKQLLQQANDAQNAVNAQNAANQKAAAAEAQKQKDIANFVQQGELSLRVKQFAAAKASFEAALKLSPGLPAALRGLQEANQGLNPPKPVAPQPPMPQPKPPIPQPKPEVKPVVPQPPMPQPKPPVPQPQPKPEVKPVVPQPQPKAPDKTAQFNKHLLDGQKFLSAGQNAAAIREFEAALQISPGNPAATFLLNKAKSGKK